MSKLPPVIRPPGYELGLTGESAYHWAVFLANEADMNEDYIAYDKWKATAESIKPTNRHPLAHTVYYGDLEAEIEKWRDYGVR